MRFITVLILGILAGAEVDLFIPSFPELQKVFGLSTFMVELTLGVNLTAHCITALMVGNLGDKYGRKPIILIGLFIFILGSIACVFATHYWMLLLGRFLQGIGVSGPAVLGYLIIADSYPMKKQQQLMGMLNGIITFAMACAPVVGSYVSLFFNWQGNFVVLLILGIISFIFSALFIVEQHVKVDISISLKEYLPVIKSSKALYYIFSVCFLTQAYWVFIGISPILYMKDLGVTLENFGLYQGSIAGVFSIFCLTSGFFIKTFGQKKCFYSSMVILGLFVLNCFAFVVLDIRSPLLITIIMQFAAIGVILPINILWPLSLEAVEGAKARIQAIFVSMRLILTAIFIQIVSYFYNGTFFYIGICMCLTFIISFWAIYKLLFTHDKSTFESFKVA